MFEDFSFSSPTSTRPLRLTLDPEDRVMVDCDSTLISPLSSRCPSPKSSHRVPRTLSRPRSLHFRPPQPPTSVPAFYEHKRLSISTLTKKLHEHTLKNSPGDESNDEQSASPTTPHSIPDLVPSSPRFPGYFLTPPDTDHDDEGYCDSSSVTSSSISLPQSPYLSPTSAPAEFVSLDGSMDFPMHSPHDQISVRLQRQRISRLQCSATSGIEGVRRAYLGGEDVVDLNSFGEDDCHPSCIPPQLSPRRRALTLNRSRFRPSPGSGLSELTTGDHRARRKSSSGPLPNHRIEKLHQPFGRELRKKSDQELRRKSLVVSVALASMAEKASPSHSNV